jgi:putative phosphoesterase
VRIAALYDIHGNLPALRAVLEEVRAERPDLLVIGGDVVAGPMPAEVLEALQAAGTPLRWVMGNGDREVLAPGAGDEPPEVVARWACSRLSAEQLAFVAAFEPTVAAGGVLFCHGSPRSDEERLTRVTPADRFAQILRDVDERLVVCGHTHQQFDRTVAGPDNVWRAVNAGSIGMPYEGEPGAFWALIDGGEPALRRTAYDVEAAAAELRAGGMPDVDGFMLRESLLEPADPEWVARFMEWGDEE